MIEFVLAVVQTVLGGLIVDLFGRRRPHVDGTEIEMALATAARQRQVADEELKKVVGWAMAELLFVVAQDNHLAWQRSRLSAATPLALDPQHQVAEEFDRMDFLIQARWRQLTFESIGRSGGEPDIISIEPLEMRILPPE